MVDNVCVFNWHNVHLRGTNGLNGEHWKGRWKGRSSELRSICNLSQLFYDSLSFQAALALQEIQAALHSPVVLECLVPLWGQLGIDLPFLLLVQAGQAFQAPHGFLVFQADQGLLWLQAVLEFHEDLEDQALASVHYWR